MNKAEYISRHYRLVVCDLCYTDSQPLYYNEEGEVICERCIVVDEDEDEEGEDS